ncbi:hypothetical protein QLX67_09190, partial [Balneolaceae bacterium ANBcel3]|nr:hypothetical protein [Balneolaceae bacterium ANBcel3]
YTLHQQEIREYPVSSFSVHQNTTDRQSVVDIELEHAVPVSSLRLHIDDKTDYYRHISIQTLRNRFRTQNGWQQDFVTLKNGVIHSITDASFTFKPQQTSVLRVLIHNQDNPPLNVDSVSIAGYTHELIVRFPDQASDYFLLYGNKDAPRPMYDLRYFLDSAPEDLLPVHLSQNVVRLTEAEPSTKKPLINHIAWLWGLLLILMLLLGWFSFRMLGKAYKNSET